MAEWLERNRANLAAALVVLVAVAAVALAQLPRRSALQVISPSAAMPPTIKVHVVGAVLTPGVYQLTADARIEDALKAAGGPSDAADLVSLNLATPLKDGQQVAIPQTVMQSLGAASPSDPTAPSVLSPPSSPSSPSRPSPTAVPATNKLDLNSASRPELEALPSIGPVTAQKILDYRQNSGRIGSLEELRDAKVITSSMYGKIKDLVEAR